MLSQVIALALGKGNRFHNRGIGQHQLLGEIEIAQSLRIALGIDANYAKTVGTARMLHTTEEDGWLEIFIGVFEAVELRVAHTSRIKRIEGRVSLLQKFIVQLTSSSKVAIDKPRIRQRSVHKDIRGVPLTIFQATDDTVLRLIGFGISEGESCHHFAIHRETIHELPCPIYERIIVALFLIAIGKLSESLVREAVLGHVLQKFSCLAIVGAFVVAVCKL